MSPTVFPVLWSQLLNMKRSEKSPVELVYEIPPVAERDVRLIFVAREFERLEILAVLALV